ncbi:hypothetical protein I7I51_04610, partial [Histoplasma capsulatum]
MSCMMKVLSNHIPKFGSRASFVQLKVEPMLSALLNSFASVESVDWTECVVKCESLRRQRLAESKETRQNKQQTTATTTTTTLSIHDPRPGLPEFRRSAGPITSYCGTYAVVSVDHKPRQRSRYPRNGRLASSSGAWPDPGTKPGEQRIILKYPGQHPACQEADISDVNASLNDLMTAMI